MTDYVRVHAYAEHTYVEKFPVTSILLAGVKHYKDTIENIKIDDILNMTFEPNNQYDASAIVIKKNEEICGYVPQDCQEKIKGYVPSQVKVIDKKFLHKTKIWTLRVDIV